MSRVSDEADALGGQTLTLLDFPVRVYGLDRLSPKEKQRRLAGVFFLHGRMEKSTSDSSFAMIKSILDTHAEQKPDYDLLVISVDQNNHGSRKVYPERNLAFVESKYPERNPTHALDMYMMVDGIAKDISSLIDFVPMYLFPDGSHTFTTWAMTGISLGGHATWHTLKTEPRIQVAVPLIGAPNMYKLTKARAEAAADKFPAGTHLIPAQLEAFSEQYMAINPHDIAKPEWKNRSLLSIQGAEDTLVITPLTDVIPTIEALKAQHIDAHLLLEPFAKHEVTPHMRSKASEFLISKIAQWYSKL